MAKFMISYIGGNQPATPEEGRQNFAKYQQWLNNLGDAALQPMNPLRDMHTVGPDGSVDSSSSTQMSGFTVVEAESIEQALEMAKACPFLDIGGSLEVSEMVQMPG